MKNFLFLLALILGIGIHASSQNYIELIGEGVIDVDEYTLTIPDPGTVEKVIVHAAGFYDTEAVPAPGTVVFYDNNESYEVGLTPVDINESPHPYGVRFYFGHFIATFDDTDGEITLDKNGEGENVLSFYAYVFRESGYVDMYTLVNEHQSFFFRNGSDEAVQYMFNIAPSDQPRDLELEVPFSDNEEEAERYAYIQLIADSYTIEDYIILNNDDDNFRIENLVLEDVPGDVTQVIVEIYSPANEEQGGNDPYEGDSFLVGMLLLHVEKDMDEGCTLTQGYWKTHSMYGPAKKTDPTWDLIGPDTEFFLSDMSYIEVIKKSPKGNAYYILAQQYIAAELNFLAGADPDAAWDAFSEATELFEMYTPEEIEALKGSNDLRKEFIYLADVLDEYNNGLIGPGHCDDDEMAMDDSYESGKPEKSSKAAKKGNSKKSAVIDVDQIEEVSVYPNPVSHRATVSFVPVADGLATVKLYNLSGQMVKQVFHQQVIKDLRIDSRFDVDNLLNGTYIIQIENESMRVHKKLQINR